VGRGLNYSNKKMADFKKQRLFKLDMYQEGREKMVFHEKNDDPEPGR